MAISTAAAPKLIEAPRATDPEAEAPPEQRVARWLVYATLIAMAVVGGTIALFLFKGFYIDWLWYGSVGFQSTYLKLLVTKALLFIMGLLAAGALLFGNVSLARRTARARWNAMLKAAELAGALPDDGPREKLVSRDIGKLLYGLAALVTLGLAFLAYATWDEVIRLPHATDFGVADPLHGRDVAYYVFQLPILQALRTFLLSVSVVALISAAALYFARLIVPQAGGDGLRLDEETGDRRLDLAFGPAVRRHLTLLGAATFGLLAWHYKLRLDELVFSNTGTTYGAGFTSVTAVQPALYALLGLCVLAAIGLLAGVALRGPWIFAASFGIFIPVWIIALLIWPNVVQRLQVAPNELELETPFIERNIKMTRLAYGLDRVQETQMSVAEAVTREEVEANPATLKNVRVWDYEPLLATYNQIQSIRGYYGFLDADFDRYLIDGEYRQVMIAGRELTPNRLPPDAQTWINRRLQFTHGYGVVVSPVNEVHGEGLPSLLVQDVPPRGKIPVSRPEIYYGESGAGWVVVKSKVPEFDYPRGSDNAEVTYQGTSGVNIGSLFRRFLFAWQLTDFNLLVTPALTNESSILFHRSVQARIERVAPFLQYDSDPYLVIADGKLVWLQDAYTSSGMYPYSQPFSRGMNYLRNSVKVTVDAYDGSIAFYVSDDADPIIGAYDAAFPGMFKTLSDMPPALRAHVRYPGNLFQVQTAVYSRYHMQDPRVFYQREDQLVLPQEKYLAIQRLVPVRPYYGIMKLPGEAREEFLYVQPYTPPGKDNMITWLAARSDGANYGKLVSYKYPKDSVIFGPQQVEARIDQDPTISAQLTLWNQGGSRVLRGNMLAIPIGRSNLYIEPIYLQGSGSELTELKRVVVATGNRVAMGLTVDDALAQLYGGAIAYQAAPTVTSGTTTTPPTVTVPAPVTQPPVSTPAQQPQQAQPSAPAPATTQPAAPATGAGAIPGDRQAMLDAVRSLQERNQRLMQEQTGVADDLRRLLEALERAP
ncbi:MAG TPA: UPF0182 family protein [Chloroflexota bacterium]|nr:UPF0182 family protein [Chloroflexota bacterium]